MIVHIYDKLMYVYTCVRTCTFEEQFRTCKLLDSNGTNIIKKKQWHLRTYFLRMRDWIKVATCSIATFFLPIMMLSVGSPRETPYITKKRSKHFCTRARACVSESERGRRRQGRRERARKIKREREREREGESMFVCLCVYVCLCVIFVCCLYACRRWCTSCARTLPLLGLILNKILP